MLLCLTALNAWANVRFVLGTGEAVTYHERMTIDAPSYVENARQMIAEGRWLTSPDTYHSAGMSAYVSVLLRVFDGSILSIKLGSFVLWLTTLALVFLLVRRVGMTATWSYLAIYLCSASELLQKYCAVVQYEVPVMFLLTLFAFTAARPVAHLRHEFALGALAGLLCTFRLHFVLLLLLYLGARVWSLLRARGRAATGSAARAVGVTLLGYVTIALPWNVAYSAAASAPVFFQSSLGVFLERLNPNATGVMWPYPEAAQPHGIEFIATRPDLYILLLGRRFLYLFGFVPDVWAVRSRFAEVVGSATGLSYWSARTVFATFYVVLLAGGVAHLVASLRRGRSRPGLTASALCAAAVLAPQFIAGSSTRFLVPIVPTLLCLQLAAAAALSERLREVALFPLPAVTLDSETVVALPEAGVPFWLPRRWLERWGVQGVAGAVVVASAATILLCAVLFAPDAARMPVPSRTHHTTSPGPSAAAERAPRKLALDLGTQPTRASLDYGFSGNETVKRRSVVWSDGDRARLCVHLSPLPMAYVLQLEGAAFWALAPLSVSVRVNDRQVGTLTFTERFTRQSLELAPGALVSGLNTVLLEFEATGRPVDFEHGSRDGRNLALLLDHVRLAPAER